MRIAFHRDLDPIPRAVLGPAVETPPHRLPGRKASRQIPSRRTSPEPRADRLNNRPAITPPAPSRGARSGSNGSIRAHISSLNTWLGPTNPTPIAAQPCTHAAAVSDDAVDGVWDVQEA